MDHQEKLELLLFCVFTIGSVIFILYFRWLERWEKSEQAKIKHEKYKSELAAKDYYKGEEKMDYGKILRLYLTKHLKK